MKQYPHFAATCGDYHDVVKDFRGPSPEIVALCGSQRFRDEYHAESIRLTVHGKIVLTSYLDYVNDLPAIKAAGIADVEDLRDRMTQLNRRRIDLADTVMVINVGGYIGEATRSEIEYAYGTGKQVEYLELPIGTPNFRRADDSSKHDALVG